MNISTQKKSILSLLLIALQTNICLAQNELSLSQVWNKPQDKLETQSDNVVTSSSTKTVEATKELISFYSMAKFEQSKFMKGLYWPSIGPFKKQSDNSYVDIHDNKIELTLNNQNDITNLRFFYPIKKITNFELLNIEVISDFLLESLNCDLYSISVFNEKFNTNHENIKNYTVKQPLSINLNQFDIDIFIENSIVVLNVMSSKNESNVRVLAQSKQNLIDKLIEEDKKPNQESPETPKQNKNSVETTASEQTNIQNDNSTQTNSEKNTPKIVTAQETKADNKLAQNKTPKSQSTKTNSNETATKPQQNKSSDLKSQLESLITNWQKAKQKAIKDLDSKSIENYLAQKALKRQQDGIKWLENNHDYYDLTPISVKVNKFDTITKDSKYYVYVTINEVSKLVDKNTNKVLQQTKDKYNVKYTILKINNKLFIVDSALEKK